MCRYVYTYLEVKNNKQTNVLFKEKPIELSIRKKLEDNLQVSIQHQVQKILPLLDIKYTSYHSSYNDSSSYSPCIWMLSTRVICTMSPKVSTSLLIVISCIFYRCATVSTQVVLESVNCSVGPFTLVCDNLFNYFAPVNDTSSVTYLFKTGYCISISIHEARAAIINVYTFFMN